MSVGPIGPSLPAAPRLQLEDARQRPPQSSGGPSTVADTFGAMFSDAIAQLDALQKNADSLTTRLAAGEAVDLHDVTIAVEQANLGFQFAMSVRNKLIEAYQEIARMQV
ncbi:MAG: flagellar hook-basal body complex protein FliE [Chloroflexi bacterium]|nr:flagellar hook-basal body complex protein FliE [Chloroflexota bacterium]